MSNFVFDATGIICLSVLFVIFLVQIFFYLFYYNKPLVQSRKAMNCVTDNSTLPSVSVIVVVKNDSENLEKNLPLILNQDYHNYEVIVVNDGLTDESEFVLENLKREHSNLYTTFTPVSSENDYHRKKVLSLTIAIKAATKEILLFTEVDCSPMDTNWISSMMSEMTPDKDIVLGYCRYDVRGGVWSNIAIFDNLIFSLQYLSMAIRNKPFTGVYRNLAYRKELFFDNKGFSSSLKYENAEDVFLNNILSRTNTSVALAKSSFVSCHLENYSMWKFIKVNYMRAKSHFRNSRSRIFHIETFSRYLFYLLFAGIVVYSVSELLWLYLGIGILFFISRFVIQYVILRKASDYFETDRYSITIPIFDIVQVCSNWYFKCISNKKNK